MLALAVEPRVFAEPGQVGHELPRVRKGDLSQGCQVRGTPVGAVEERSPERLFEPGDSARNRGLCRVKRFGRGREGLFGGCHHEDSKILWIYHTGSVSTESCCCSHTQTGWIDDKLTVDHRSGGSYADAGRDLEPASGWPVFPGGGSGSAADT